MTENKIEKVSETAKELLALHPKQESEFKQKMQEAKKNKSNKVGKDVSCEPSVFVWYFLSKDITNTIFRHWHTLANAIIDRCISIQTMTRSK